MGAVNNNALVHQPSTALEPGSIPEAVSLATLLHKSGLLSADIKTPEAAFAIIMAGRELGLTAMQSLRSIYIVKGKIGLSADLMVALCKNSPDCEHFTLVESTDKVARYVAKRKGEEETAMEFTMEEARLANLANGGSWKSYPKAMLRARCASALARAVFPDKTMGIYDSTSGEIDEVAKDKRAIKAVAEPAPVVVELDPEFVKPGPPVETMKQKTERWLQILRSAKTLEQLNTARQDVRAELDRMGGATGFKELTTTLSAAYQHCKSEIESAGEVKE